MQFLTFEKQEQFGQHKQNNVKSNLDKTNKTM